MTRDDGNPAIGGIDGPFCSPQISAHSHSFGAVPGFSNLLIILKPLLFLWKKFLAKHRTLDLERFSLEIQKEPVQTIHGGASL